jgi:hypothetical protein
MIKATWLLRHKQSSTSQPPYIPQTVFKRLWWHTRGIATVFGILILVFGSLIFLNLHWFSQNIIGVRTKRSQQASLSTN